MMVSIVKQTAGILLLIGMKSSIIQSNGLACESIKDHDQRHYCRAMATGRVTWCEVIRDGDLRHRCRAEISWKKR